MVPLSGAWALASGMRIHTDFSTPLGLAYYLPYYWTLKVFGNGAAVVRHTESAIFVVAAVITFLLLRPPRYSWMVTALGVASVSLQAASPTLMGRSPVMIYEGIAYNYIGIAAGCLCLLTALFPPQGDPAQVRRREISDALLLAAILVWVAFVKINFLVQAGFFLLVVFLLFGLGQSGRIRRFYGVLAGGFVLMALLFILIFQVHLGAMFQDIRMAARCRSHWVLSTLPSMDRSDDITAFSGIYASFGRVIAEHQAELALLAVTLLGGVAAVFILGRMPVRRVLVYACLMLLVLASDLFQDMFNSYQGAIPMLACLWLFVMCVLERDKCLRDEDNTTNTARITRNWVSMMAAMAVVCHCVILAIGYLAAFSYNSGLAGRLHRSLPLLAIDQPNGIQAKGWEKFFYEGPENSETNTPFADKVNDGLNLLRQTHSDQRCIFVLDQINPFPLLLRAPYPKGQPAWMHVQATFDSENHLPAETVFGGADVVMIPKQPVNRWCARVLSEVYKSYFQSNYDMVTESGSWWLAARNNNESR